MAEQRQPSRSAAQSRIEPDVYLLAAHEPYEDPRHPVAINATIVHALTLLHPDLPQPDGGMIFRCLTEFPGRKPGEVVPISTLTFELDGGRLWSQVADWAAVTEAVARLARAGRCDSMPLGLPAPVLALLTNGPTSDYVARYADGGEETFGPAHRQQELDTLTGHIRAHVSSGPIWPGSNLVAAPDTPSRMPYQPYRSVLR